MSRMLFHEEWAIVATIDPIDGNAADSSTDEIDMSKWEEVCFLFLTGVIAASSTIDFKIRESQTSGGSLQDITGKAMTQYTATDDSKHVMICVKAEELSAGYRYIKGVMDNSAHSQLVAVVALGRGKYRPASDDDLADVKEIVV